MLKALFLSLTAFLFTSPAFSNSLPSQNSGKMYLSEKAGNWAYLPNTDKTGKKDLVCLALSEAPPYAVVLRGIAGEFGLSLTKKNWDLPKKRPLKLRLATPHSQLEKTAYALDSWTVTATLSQKERQSLLQNLSQEKQASFFINNQAQFTLSLKGSARILSLLEACLKTL